jgi:7-cyano-7-deazaguanine synthase
MESSASSRALVLFSGGQDSTTCLAWALREFEGVETVGFDYGQRHHVEMDCRLRILNSLQDVPDLPVHRLGPDHVLDLHVLGDMSETSLTRQRQIDMMQSGLPSTFVPGRNLIFLTFAAALAYRRGCRHLVLGVCETDFSGYPDCRDDTIKAMQVAINLGMDERFILHTPLMWRDKASTFALAHELGGDTLIEVICEESHSCYLGDRNVRHAWGYGCGTCPACRLRANGWSRWSSQHSRLQSNEPPLAP